MTNQRPAQYYRDRASEARVIAQRLQDDNCVRTFLNIAAGYEDLANHIERTGTALDAKVVQALKIETTSLVEATQRRRLGGKL